MDSIYKINQISFNNSKTQFCICFNNGIKNFSTEKFEPLYSSNVIGNISLGALFHELNIVIFVGSENNEEYNKKKLVIFDLIKQKTNYSTTFLNEILSIKIIDKYLIVGFEFELKIFSLEKQDTISPINEIPLPNYDIYELWGKANSEIVSSTQLYLVYSFKNKIFFNTLTGLDLQKDEEYEIKSPCSKIQNFFYIEKLNQVFIPDETAYYIYSINPDDGKQVLCLYRGKNPGYITSITLLNKNYLAVNNINRKIHIFDINEKTNNYNIGNLIGGMIYGSYISPFMRIPYDKIIKKNEGEFYDNDFQKKGALLASETDGIVLKIVAYNGYAYNIRINFLKKDFEVIYRKKICVYDINDIHEEPVNESEPCSYNSIFDKQKKGGEEDKFVVLK
jgi:hypothetical protein